MMITGWGGYNHVGYAQKVGSWVHPISIDLRSTVNMLLIKPTWTKFKCIVTIETELWSFIHTVHCSVLYILLID